MMSRYFYSFLLSLSLIFSAQGSSTISAAWIEYADNDIRAAHVVMDVKNPLIGIALYHIEQAVEKALKAYLIAHEVAFALTHDLKPLLASCSKLDSGFTQFESEVKVISPYATKSRYPNKSYTPPSPDEVEELIEKAESIVNYVYEGI